MTTANWIKNMGEEKVFGYCGACETYCYRILGKIHGDGQIDSEENPVWLMIPDEESVQDADFKTINCGCNG